MNTQAYGERFETAIESSKFDYKGRKIGYLVILVDNGIDFRACVQNARLIKNEWVAFGATQGSKKFSSQEFATAWAYSTAKERIAKLA